jgi:hypothetical protein
VPNTSIINNSGTSIITCNTSVINLTATGGVSYSWDNGLGNTSSVSNTSPGTYTYSTALTLPSGATNWIDVDVSFSAEWISANSLNSTITCTLQWNTAPLTNTTVTISSTAGCGNSGQSIIVGDTGSQEAHTWNFKGEVPGSISNVSTITVQVSMVIAGTNLNATSPGYLWAKATCK